MKIRHIFILLLAMFAALSAKAQNISVASFRLLEMDMTANLEPNIRIDQNGYTCALIKMVTIETGFTWNVGVMGITDTQQQAGEIWVWVPFGVKHLTIGHPRFGILRDYYFPIPIEKARTYELVLKTNGPGPGPDEDLGGSFLVMSVSPTNAKVSVDGQMQETADGIVTVFLEYGKHNYRVEAPNCETEVGIVEIGREKKEMEVKLKSSQATLALTCADKDAEIYINDKKYGVGSCSCALNAGTYLAEARKQGHRTEKQVVVLGEKEQKTLVLNAPTPMFGKLKLTSTPANCEVYLDGKKIGKSPDVFADILEGPHNVELRKEGYENAAKQVTIEEGKVASLNIELTKGNGNALAQQAQQPNGAAQGPFLSFTVNGVTFRMIYVEGGTFNMGATSEQGSDAYDNEKPTHSVTLSSYYMGETEVTQALWQAVMGSNPSNFKGNNLPVEKVSWDDCQQFVTKLNQLLAGQLNGRRFALPTEAQWEYAARGGNKSRGYKYSGSNRIKDVAWYTKTTNDNGTKPVGTKQPNELGLYDMSGNVWEWCQDWYGSYRSSAQTDPTGPGTGSHHVYRGGSWIIIARYCRVSFRNCSTPDYSSHYLGLRLSLR